MHREVDMFLGYPEARAEGCVAGLPIDLARGVGRAFTYHVVGSPWRR